MLILILLELYDTQQGWSALYIASRNDHENVVKTLLEYGCDVDILTQVRRFT